MFLKGTNCNSFGRAREASSPATGRRIYMEPPRSFTRIRAVQSWGVREIKAPEGTRLAAVLETVDRARAIIIRLAPGEELGDGVGHYPPWPGEGCLPAP